jgi:DNA-binding XRE family transcriptional regulator
METPELWLPVVGYEGLYEVSDLGRIRSLVRGRLMALPICDRYVRVRLSKDDISKIHNVHSLVCLAFIGPRPEGHDVCHWDGIKTNNRLSNLRYDTRSANHLDKRRHGTMAKGSGHGIAVLNAEAVIKIRAARAAGRSKTSIAEEFGVSRPTIYAIERGMTWRHVPATPDLPPA